MKKKNEYMNKWLTTYLSKKIQCHCKVLRLWNKSAALIFVSDQLFVVTAGNYFDILYTRAGSSSLDNELHSFDLRVLAIYASRNDWYKMS